MNQGVREPHVKESEDPKINPSVPDGIVTLFAALVSVVLQW